MGGNVSDLSDKLIKARSLSPEKCKHKILDSKLGITVVGNKGITYEFMKK